MVIRLALAGALICAASVYPTGQTSTVKALVGGTLIDGYGGRPIRNSVVLIQGERISAIGTVDTLNVPRGAFPMGVRVAATMKASCTCFAIVDPGKKVGPSATYS